MPLLDPFIANVGTMLIWSAMLHLVIGNAVIGVVEGLLLRWIFKAPGKRAILVMVLANYISAWAGVVLVNLAAQLGDVTIANIKVWLVGLALLSFLLTIVLEWPLIAWALFRDRLQPVWMRALKASLLIHCVSYVFLVAWYISISMTSLADLKVVPASELVPESLKSATIYYIDPSSTQVLESKLDGSEPSACGPTFAKNQRNELFVRQVQEGEFQLLIAPRLNTPKKTPREALPIKTLRAPLVPLQYWEGAEPASSFSELPMPAKSEWSFLVGSWAYDGIKAKHLETKKVFRYGLETPFVVWYIYDAIHLQGDLLLFQLGFDQICLLDPATKRIALLARGSNPIMIPETQTAQP